MIAFVDNLCMFAIIHSLIKPHSDHKRPSGIKSLIPENLGANNKTAGGQGYATNFGSGLTGNAESQVIAAIFKSIVTRFVDAQKELKAPENMGLYCDVRQLITYIKGAHGGPFRRVVLSGILAVTPRPHKKGPLLQTTRVIRYEHFRNKT